MSGGQTVSLATDHAPLQRKFDAARAGLRANVQTVLTGEPPVLIEGAEYRGIWLECGPHESLLYGLYFDDPETAMNGHRIFFRHQSEDGYLPCWIRKDRIGGGQVQSVVPIAKTALKAYRCWGDRAFLAEAYDACARYDDWLSRYRDTRGTGLVELFCDWDTGHDNSPRVSGLPHTCPNDDARVCPELPDEFGMPRIAPDLSAMKYGGRIALSHMAARLGRREDFARWWSLAEETRRRLRETCYDPETACFYDLDRNGRFIRIAGDALTRVLQEHAIGGLSDAKATISLFDTIYERWIGNPEAFWTPYPLPSIAANDPTFVRDLPHNSWGGASQALTALRAPRWMEHYGKYADLTHLMERWVEALCRDEGFRQQMNPWTGEFTASGSDGYSPAMLVLLDFVARLYGARLAKPGIVEWNCRMPPETKDFHFCTPLPRGGTVEVLHRAGEPSELRLDGAVLAIVVASHPCRIGAERSGNLRILSAPDGGEFEVREAKTGIIRKFSLGPGRSAPLFGKYGLPSGRSSRVAG